MRARQLLAALVTFGVGGCGASDESAPLGQITLKSDWEAPPIGLSLRFVNGDAAPLQLLGDAPRYLQEIDVSETVTSFSDEGIEPLIESSALSVLDWSGVQQVEEIWVPSLDGTFTRERYFRGATWMDEPTQLSVIGLGSAGQELGPPLIAHAGRGDTRQPGDDGFVRRFVARQSAFGCPAFADCSGAVYVAEGLVQFRDALHPEQDARLIDPSAVALRLEWSRLPDVAYDVAVEQLAQSGTGLGYGFQVELAPLGSPANGQFYQAGEAASFRVTFRDGQGNRLHPEGQLPSYGEFFFGQVESGLRYLDLQTQTRLYYALKHRESNLLAVLSGPTDQLVTPATVVDPFLFFGPQVPFATEAVDGFTALGQTVPPAAFIFGGFSDPFLWSLPVSDQLTFTLPADAEAGTYVAAIKARREFGGEALNRGATAEIQVGQSAPTSFTAQTACTSCHGEERTNFDTVLHGLGDRRACFGCHASLGIEFDNALDIRVHTIHDRSDRFGADVANCSNCHLSTPTGAARGVLP
jgi:predicted CXXCH cytochrome family protein